MEYNPEKRQIISGKILNNLDKFVLDFIKVLEKYTDYVIISGYVSILLGRSRATEDVDLLIPNLSNIDFMNFWKKIIDSGFECINTSIPEEALDMLEEHAIRFCRKNVFIPNMELKVIKNDLDRYSFNNKLIVFLGNERLKISPLELQVAYKLYLGSEKDLEDAKHIYNSFEDKLNKQELINLIRTLKVEENFRIITCKSTLKNWK